MLRTLHAEHALSDLLVVPMVERHNRTQADLIDQMFNSSEKRLARALLILSRVGKEDTQETVVCRKSVRRWWRKWWHHPLPGEFLHEQVQKSSAS
jgi:hypothetical protein